ncbi:MAG: family 1 glycosylhydrolase [Actinobacteria bacterium]|nr:family 1 glycosylhydrolase [Actinomycetota bacterium]
MSPGIDPKEVMIGVASAGYQIEGGFNGPGEPANNWYWWERSGRVEPSGIACDFWREPEVALDRAASLGANAFRLSVEWARIEPSEGVVDQSAIDGYVSILRACRERGMRPVVTLFHFTHPRWLGEEFWLTPDAPRRFSEFVLRVVPELVEHCEYWVTINEPNILALAGWIAGIHPPGRKLAVSDAWAVTDNLLAAHVLAYRAIHRYQPGATVTVNTSASSIYEFDRMLTDLLMAPAMEVGRDELDDWIDERRIVHNFSASPETRQELWMRQIFEASSPYGSGARSASNRPGLPCSPARRSRFRSRQSRRVVDLLYAEEGERLLDVVGFDWYDPVASHALALPGREREWGRILGRSWSPVRELWDTQADPAALARWCVEHGAFYGGVPVWIVENGMSTLVRNGRSYPRADGMNRPRYLAEHFGAVARAVASGAPLGAYLHWSLVDNYEWGSYGPRFGIFGMDRSRGSRGVRWMETDAAGYDSAGAFRRLVSALRDGSLDDAGSVGTLDARRDR